MLTRFTHSLKPRISHSLEWADQRTWGLLGILKDTIRLFNEVRAPEAAASIAYYALFSLFPLLLVLATMGSYFIESQEVQAQLLFMFRTIFPVAGQAIFDNLAEILKERGQFGLVGAVGLLWSSSAAFITLFRNINRAWRQAKPLGIVRTRLVAMGTVIFLGLLLVVNLFASAVVDLLPRFVPSLGNEGSIYNTQLWPLLSDGVPGMLTMIIFLALYRWVPNTHVRWHEAFWGALVAALGIEITTGIFTWFLSSGWAAYHVVYGSLGAIVAMLFWIYINSLMILFGANLTATIAARTRPIPTLVPAESETIQHLGED